VSEPFFVNAKGAMSTFSFVGGSCSAEPADEVDRAGTTAFDGHRRCSRPGNLSLSFGIAG
jgi:hypothetical protein